MKIDWDDTFVWFIVTLIVLGLFVPSCIAMRQKASVYKMHEPASVCDYRVAFIYRATYKTEEDFYRNVTAQIEWLREHGYEVINLNYEYGNDMTQNLILRFACIKYKEKENGNRDL